MSDSSRTVLLYSPEAVFDEAPSPAGGVMKQMRISGVNLQHHNETTESDEITGDRQLVEMIKMGENVDGGFNGEFQFATWDDWMEAALCGTWATNIVNSGSVFRSFYIEEKQLDIAKIFTYKGAVVEEFNLDIVAGQKIEANVVLKATKGDGITTSLGTTVTAPNSNPPITAGPWITGIVNTVSAANIATGKKFARFSLKVKNNYRDKKDIQSFASGQFGMGQQEISGSFQVYLLDLAETDQFTDDVVGDFTINVKNPADITKFYTFRFPRYKVTAAPHDVTGKNNDIMLDVAFRGTKDPTLGTALRITRVP